jgi:hypothetical protein
MKRHDELLKLIWRKAFEFSKANGERVSDEVVEQAVDLLVNKVDLISAKTESQGEIVKEINRAASCLRIHTVVLMEDTIDAEADSLTAH